MKEIPETNAHEEVHNLLAELERMHPEILEMHGKVKAEMRASKSRVDDCVSQAQQNVAKSNSLLNGEVPESEIQAMWQAELGEDIIPPPIPNAPQGLSDDLERELMARANPRSAKPLSPLESNAWNDWELTH